jgi:hypothetical protein
MCSAWSVWQHPLSAVGGSASEDPKVLTKQRTPSALVAHILQTPRHICHASGVQYVSCAGANWCVNFHFFTLIRIVCFKFGSKLHFNSLTTERRKIN